MGASHEGPPMLEASGECLNVAPKRMLQIDDDQLCFDTAMSVLASIINKLRDVEVIKLLIRHSENSLNLDSISSLIKGHNLS